MFYVAYQQILLVNKVKTKGNIKKRREEEKKYYKKFEYFASK